MFAYENKLTKVQGIPYSRYIASWTNEVLKAGRKTNLPKYSRGFFSESFAEWLKVNGCTEEEINDIRYIASNGKLELEMTAAKYVYNWIMKEEIFL